MFGKMRERSRGKDTTTGHWEIAGIIMDKPFPTYPDGFPDEIIAAFRERTGRGVWPTNRRPARSSSRNSVRPIWLREI